MRPAVELPVGTVTFLFTDIEGSTRLLRELGDAYPGLLADHHAILREAIERSGGAVFGTEGDAVFAAFGSAPRAVAAAIEAERCLATRTWPAGATVRVRMGIHTGEGTLGGDTYVGLDVHRVARIAGAAHGGQVLLSAATRVLAETSLDPGVVLRDLGEHRLKDLARPEHLFQVVADGLETEFPPPRSLDAMPNNLPTQLTSFVGREREVAEARRLLGRSRLLTLTGPGGTGKTRLSLRLAAEVMADFPDGVFFVPLAPVEEPALVPSAILRALAIQDSGSRPPQERLAEHLRERDLLLVLDNFEQVLPAAPLVAELLRAAPRLRIVVTSRSILHISGEHEYAVLPLGVPDPAHLPGPDALSQFEAVALFVERAAAVRPGFEVTNANAAAVAEICARLDGLPLAIELAAARIRLLPPQALLSRLSSRLDLAGAGASDLPTRQRTLRGAIAWSHDLLEEGARVLFARLAVFAGGASIDAITSVCGSELNVDVLDGLGDLVDQSLLRQDDVDGEPRFWMLATIREFAMERLRDGDDERATLERHVAHYLAFAEAAAPELTGPNQRANLDGFDRDNDNLRAALATCLERDLAESGLRLGAAMWRFWQMRGLLVEGATWLDRLLALDHGRDHPMARAGALEAAGGVAYWRGDMPTAYRFYEECLSVCRAIGRPDLIANALYNAAFPRVVSGYVDPDDLDGAEEDLQESLEIYRSLGDRPAIGRVLWALATRQYYRGELALARDMFMECVAILREGDDRFSLGWGLHTLGLAHHRLGDTRAAEAPWREALEIFAGARDLSGIALLLGDVALAAAARGDRERAVLLASASSQLVATGGVRLGALIDELEHRETGSMGDLADPVLAAALEAGRSRPVDEVAAEAIGWLRSLESGA